MQGHTRPALRVCECGWNRGKTLPSHWDGRVFLFFIPVLGGCMRIVMKFGGTSVGDGERIKNVADLLVANAGQGHAVVAVVSAMSGITDILVRAARQAADGDVNGFLVAERTLLDRHLAAIDAAVDDPAGRT